MQQLYGCTAFSCIARRCTAEWLCALMQFVRLISIIASFSCCAARSHSRLLSQCLKHLHDATILITGVLNQTSCHTIMSLCSGLETLLQKTAGKYCVGDEVRDSYSLASFPGLSPLDLISWCYQQSKTGGGNKASSSVVIILSVTLIF